MKVLIMGCGNQGCLADALGSGNEHKTISFAKAFKERHAQLTFIDKNMNKAKKAAEIYNGYYTYNGCFDEKVIGKFDIIVITTPDETHYNILKRVIDNKSRLVICEKPFCETVAEAQEIIKLYKKAGIALLINYSRRFIPELIELKRRYESGEFGDLETYQILYNRGDLHTGTHAIDFMNWFMNGKANRSLIINGIKDNEMFEKCDYRIWNIQLFFQKFYWQEQRIFDMPVPNYYDFSTRHVVSNAIKFLEGKEDLKCNSEDALEALEILERLKNRS